MQYAVGVSAKRSYGWWGPLPFSAKRSNPPHAVGAQYAVGTQYTVGISAKRSTGTVELTNMGGGDRCKKVKAYAVHAVNGSYKCMGSLQFVFIWYLDFIVLASSR